MTIAIFECDNGKKYVVPDRFCASCKHCTDVYYDYDGPYLFICNIGEDYNGCCEKYEKEG